MIIVFDGIVVDLVGLVENTRTNKKRSAWRSINKNRTDPARTWVARCEWS